jgi:phosphopantothenoylcysteine decarboxylase / phosphopantothenate---cysteine ligase
VILNGVKCLVTAGPTYEAIDPVRFIGNRSSGKMGIEIATELSNRGAEVHLVLGPSSILFEEKFKIERVESSDEMYQAVMKKKDWLQIGIFSAAVADYKPKLVAEEKIKKSDAEFSIELIKTKDILKEVGLNKKENQVIVGFALETNNEIENAKYKIERKNLDIIILNSLRNEGAGFQHDTNQISILDRQNNITHFELKTKKDVAMDIVDYIENWN